MPPGSPALPILILDDDAVMRDLLEALLTLEGYAPVLTSSGEEALAAIRDAREPFLAALSDVQLPGLSGEALMRALRGALPAATLLLGMSGSALPEPLTALVDGFVPKPFSPEEFEDALAAATERRREAPVSQPESAPDPAGEDGDRPVLNPAIFGSLAKMLPAAKLQELFALTVDDIGKRHQRMEAAAAAGDLATVHREAHAVKGSCGMVGAAELQMLAAELEGGTSVNTSALAEIPPACERLRRMLQSKLQSI